MTGKVYFLGGPGRIKIGWTTQPEQRLKHLQGVDMETLSMLAIVDAPRGLEHHLHVLAAPHRLRGEWFTDCPEVRSIMDRTVSGEIKVDEQAAAQELSPDSREYFYFKRLPILDARAEATRLYREFLEELLAAINRRKAAGKPVDDLLAEMKAIDPDKDKAPEIHIGDDPPQ